MRICPVCGKMNDDNARFCEDCGSSMADAANVSTESEQLLERQEEQAEQPKDEPPKIERPSDKKKQKKIQKKDGTITVKKPDGKKLVSAVKGISKLQKIVILEVLILVIVVAAFFGIQSRRYSAQAVAERYYKAYVEKDWDAVYKMSSFPWEGFCGKAQFKKNMKEQNIPEITNFKVHDDDKVKKEKNIRTLMNRSFTVEYSIKGKGTETTSFVLIRQPKKAMLFFDTWKVLDDKLLTSNLIYVPSGAELVIDDMKVLGTYCYGKDCYRIPLFAGTHKIKVVVPWFDEYETEFSTDSEELHIDDMEVSKEGETALLAKLQEALEQYYQAAMAGEDFDKVKGLFAENSECMKDNEACYEELKDNLKSDERYSLKQIQFDDFDGKIYPDEYTGYLAGDMEYDYTINYTYTYSDGETEDDDSTGHSDIYAQFVYDGKTYKLNQIDLNSVWY